MSTSILRTDGEGPPVVAFSLDNLVWNFFRDEVGGAYVAVCDSLGLTASGTTMEDLFADANGAILDLFMYLVAENQLRAFLEAKGWSEAMPKMPIPEGARFDVPFDLRKVSSAAAAHAA